jgi:hypothetical protein
MTPEERTARVLLVLAPLPTCRAPWAALRKILKVLLRSFSWKCVRAELLPASDGGGSHEERHQEARGP